MKPFVFSLERMRSYKEQLLNKEKEQLAKLQRERNYIEDEIKSLKEYRFRECEKIKNDVSKGLTAMEMSSHNFLMTNTKRQIEALEKELVEAEKKVEKQLQIVIEASKDRNGLDKLEEKQLEEYKLMESKANEASLSEHVSISMVKRRMDQVDL